MFLECDDLRSTHSDSLDLSGNLSANKAEAKANEHATQPHHHLPAEEVPDLAGHVVSNLSILDHDVFLRGDLSKHRINVAILAGLDSIDFVLEIGVEELLDNAAEG